MANWGILIEYEWCTGCHSCETACQMEHNYPPEQFGIKLSEVGPWSYGDGKWELANVPIPTDQCDFCADRVKKGKLPTCQQHCQAQCLEVGPVEELAKTLVEKKHCVLFHN